jgi:hypothetical protein
MRALAEAERIRRFMSALAEAARASGRVYFAGGATAVLLGWRPTTIDVDLCLVPEQDALLYAIPALKEKLQLNVELALNSALRARDAGVRARARVPRSDDSNGARGLPRAPYRPYRLLPPPTVCL